MKPGLPMPVLLLLFSGQLLVLGARVHEGQDLQSYDLLPAGLWLLSALLLSAWLSLGRFEGSQRLWQALLLYSALGILVQARMMGTVAGLSGLGLWIQPLSFFWLGLAWTVSRKGRIRFSAPLWPLAALASLALVAALLALGTRFRGAVFAAGGLTPTELLKLSLPLALSGYLARNVSTWKGKGPLAVPLGSLLSLGVFWALLSGLLLLQRDLGMLLLLSLLLLAQLIAVSGRISWGLLATLLMGAAGWLVWRFVEHGAKRIEAWLDPFADPTGSGWQVLQALSGLYAGGLSGTGLGEGAPERLPIAGSDFVYAVVGEELGYLGCILLLALIAIWMMESFRVVSVQSEDFARIFGCGLAAVLAAQVVVNIAGVVSLMPVTGIPLPWFSQGGSSSWVTAIQFGILLGLSEQAQGKGSGKKASGTSKGKGKAKGSSKSKGKSKKHT